MALEENTHITFTNDTGDDVVGVVKGHKDGKYTVQVRSELSSGETMDVDEKKVRELKVSSQNAEACPVVGHSK